MPSHISQKPRHSIWFLPKKDLSILHLIPISFHISIVSSNFTRDIYNQIFQNQKVVFIRTYKFKPLEQIINSLL